MGPAQRLRTAIDRMPIDAKQAMLEGIHKNGRIILGAYADKRGGVCPMLAAHRCGQRRSFNNFVQAWDQYTGATTRPRAATQREMRTLVTMLETSISLQQTDFDLEAAAADHRVRRESRTPVESTGRARPRRDVRKARRDVEERRTSDSRVSDEARAREARLLEARERRLAEARARRRRELEGQRRGESREERLPKTPKKRHQVDTGEKSRVRELRERPGWAWLRVFRDHDSYEAAMERLREQELREAVRAERELDLERV